MERTAAPTILTTALARVDRRALPEAWYAALHLAHAAPPPSPAPHRVHAAAGTPRGARPAPAVPIAPQTTRSAVPPVSRGADAVSGRGGAPDRRAVANALARKLEGGIARAATRRAASAFTISLAEGRVRVVVRQHAGRTSVVALCAPVLRERVERALAHARFALAARGVRTEAA